MTLLLSLFRWINCTWKFRVYLKACVSNAIWDELSHTALVAGCGQPFTCWHTHRANFYLVSLERLQSYQGPNASAHQDFITNVVFQNVGKFLGVSCRFVGKKEVQLILRLVIGMVKENTQEKSQMVTQHGELPVLLTSIYWAPVACSSHDPSVCLMVTGRKDTDAEEIHP